MWEGPDFYGLGSGSGFYGLEKFTKYVSKA
jgi:hypothetical protein